MYCKLSKTLFVITGLAISFPALAHSGHDHSDGLHQGITAIVVAVSFAIILAAVGYYRKRVVVKKKDD